MSELLFQGGQLAVTTQSDLLQADIRVLDGIIQEIGPHLQASDQHQVINCSGKILIPALADAHVHLREPGREDAETIASGTEAALAGGFTHVLAMPNTDPPIDTGGMVTFVQTMARNKARIPVSVAGSLTQGREGSKLAEIADMATQGVVMVTDCNHALQDEYVLRRALEYTRHFDMVVGVYPDTPSLSREGVMHEGRESFRLGLPGIPAMAEEIGIERDLRVAHAVKGRIHVQNVSTAEGVATIRRFKERGLNVTAETTPHHLLLNHSALEGYGTRFKMMPPLRTPEDQAALLEGLKDGTLDMIATGHAPHTDFEKNLDFLNAPFGVVGLETALLCVYSDLILSGQLGWDTLIERLSSAPRLLMKSPLTTFEPGHGFECTILDPSLQTTVSRESFQSQSFNSPWLGETLKGGISAVWRGETDLLG